MDTLPGGPALLPPLYPVAPPGRGLYCNRTLNMRSIKVIGYDMDYTLVHYHVVEWERAAYDRVRDKLAETGLPVKGLSFDPDLVVRGLVIDTHHGNLLKVNRFGYVKSATHGTRRMDHRRMKATYGRAVVSLADPRYRFLNTLFALSEACMYAQLVNLLDAGELSGRSLGYRELYERVRASIDAAHVEGELKAEIMADPDRFVSPDEETVMALRDQHHAGKKLVLITNSEWGYTNAMMRHSFERFLPDGMRWQEMFELSVVAARKPSFWDGRAPMLKVIDDSGRLDPQVRTFDKHGVYFGGCASDVERHLGVSSDEVLYLGDHVYGDVHVSKSVLRWRTGLILRELEEEVAAIESTRDQQGTLAALMQEKEKVELLQVQRRLAMQRLEDGYGPLPDGMTRKQLQTELAMLRERVEGLDAQIAPHARAAASLHNEHWGLLMRAGNDKSQLARQIERYADVYTSRVSNFLFASPFVYLRSPRGSLPHDAVPSRFR